MDNRIFNVNGHGQKALLATISAAIATHEYKRDIEAYEFDPDKGLIFYSHFDDKGKMFPLLPGTTNEILSAQVMAWFETEAGKKMQKLCVGMDRNADHDGDNRLGWRVYVPDGWTNYNVVFIVKPAYLWYGK